MRYQEPVTRSEQLELDCAHAAAFLQTSLCIDQIFPQILAIKEALQIQWRKPET